MAGTVGNGGIPAQIGPYRVLSLLGAGGMGSVFKAESARGELVALKMIGRHNDAGARFRPGSRLPAFNRSRRVALVREARLAMELTHPHIVRVLDYGQHRGLLYLTMEFMEGQTLLSTLRQGATTLRCRLLWLAQVCDALSYAHRRGVVHRDLHANNVFVLRDQTVKLLDFGLARRVDDAALPSRIAGVPPFLAPEVLRGRARPSPAADIWSVGMLLYLSSGMRLPFEDARLRQLAANMFNGASTALDLADQSIAGLQNLVRRALDSRPDRRPSARTFAGELRQIAADAEDAFRIPEIAASPALASQHLSLPVTTRPASTSVKWRTSRPRVLQEQLASFDTSLYLKRSAFTVFSGLMLLGYIEPQTAEMPVYALAAAAALILLPIIFILPCNLFLGFKAAVGDVPRCRSCRIYMRRGRQLSQYAVNDAAVSLGIADSLACLEAGLWDDAGRLMSLHGQDSEPLLPRRIAGAPLRLQLGLFACTCCPDESAIFNVQEHREDRWVTRAAYVKAYRYPLRRETRPSGSLFRFRQAFAPALYAARASLSQLRIGVVQCVCAAGLLFIVWFTWANVHHTVRSISPPHYRATAR